MDVKPIKRLGTATWHTILPATKSNKLSTIGDLASRMNSRIQLSSDSLAQYVEAVEKAFGSNVDYGQIVKSYEADNAGSGRYSPAKVIRVKKSAVMGTPNRKYISTSIVERQNLSIRLLQLGSCSW